MPDDAHPIPDDIDEKDLYPPLEEPATDAGEEALAVIGEELLAWAAKEGLPLLLDEVTRWLKEPDIRHVSLGDLFIDPARSLWLALWGVDDTAKVLFNGDFIGGADLGTSQDGKQLILWPWREGRNLLTIEHRNSGRGRWSLGVRVYKGNEKTNTHFAEAHDDGAAAPTRIFTANMYLK